MVRRWRTESEQTFQIPFLCSDTLDKVKSQAFAHPIKKGLKVLYLNGVRDKCYSYTTYMVFYLHEYVLSYVMLCFAYCRMAMNSLCVTIIIIITPIVKKDFSTELNASN